MGSTRIKRGLAAGAIAVMGLGIGFVVGRDGYDLMATFLASDPGTVPEVLQEAPPATSPLPAADATDAVRQPGDGPAWSTNQVRIDRRQAESAALGRFGDARVLHAEIEEEDGYYLWEVLVQRADGSYIEVFVDAGDGQVVGIDHEGFDD